MQNQVALIALAFSALFTGCGGNLSEIHFFRYASPDTDSIINVDPDQVRTLRDNLYLLNDSLAVGIPYLEQEHDAAKDVIRMVPKGTLLFNDATYRLGVDTASYVWVIPDQVSKDRAKVYAFPKVYRLPLPKILKLSPAQLVVCDRANTYLKDKEHVYCVATDTYLDADPSNFETFERDGVVFGRDEKGEFYLGERIATPPDTQPLPFERDIDSLYGGQAPGPGTGYHGEFVGDEPMWQIRFEGKSLVWESPEGREIRESVTFSSEANRGFKVGFKSAHLHGVVLRSQGDTCIQSVYEPPYLPMDIYFSADGVTYGGCGILKGVDLRRG